MAVLRSTPQTEQFFFSRSCTRTFSIKRGESFTRARAVPTTITQTYKTKSCDLLIMPTLHQFSIDSKMTSTILLGKRAARPKVLSFLWVQIAHDVATTRESKALHRPFGTRFLDVVHQTAKRWSCAGAMPCHPQRRSTLNQISREKTHCTKRWLIVSASWQQRMHELPDEKTTVIGGPSFPQLFGSQHGRLA
jgi:hypothetical protein